MLVGWFRAHVLPDQGITHIHHVHVHQQFDNRMSATGTHSWRDTGFRVDIVETVSESLKLRFLVLGG